MQTIIQHFHLEFKAHTHPLPITVTIKLSQDEKTETTNLSQARITSPFTQIEISPSKSPPKKKKQQTPPCTLQSSIEPSVVCSTALNSRKDEPQRKKQTYSVRITKLFKNTVICGMKDELTKKENRTSRCRTQLSITRCFYIVDNQARKE